MSIGSVIGDAVRVAGYTVAVRNLLFMKQKTPINFRSRAGTAIDEIVLHGTESFHSQEESAEYLRGTVQDSIHYFIGRDPDHLYSIVAEDQQAFHAGNPRRRPAVQDHNPRSIGIEMYQLDISMFKGDASKLDFTDWQYDTVAMLVYDIRRRRKISKDKVVAHHAINSVDKEDPRNFDWDRFNRKVDSISDTLANLLGPEFALDQDPTPLRMRQTRVSGWPL
jgi:N-acetyl-anhydromuramyl-L-alanine amidase AmpD